MPKPITIAVVLTIKEIKQVTMSKRLLDFNKAIKIKPDYAEAYYNRGFVYAGRGEYKQAIADFDKAIALKPDLAEAYNNRGLAYAEKGDDDRAIADYDKAIALKPDYAKAYSNRGFFYLFLQQWEQAKKDLQTAQDKGLDIIALFHNALEVSQILNGNRNYITPRYRRNAKKD